MGSLNIHQSVHGYRDGHRLLSSSLGLGPDAARAMLVLSDMSGPSMHPGFDEYLTGYPLSGTDLFVFAKTWYAPEMKRPGCVWTHSLLIPREHLSKVSAKHLMKAFQRPQVDSSEKSATAPIAIETNSTLLESERLENTAIAAALLSGVLGQPHPVVIVVDTVAQIQELFLRIWDFLWPSAKALLTFCTGSLTLRTVAGELMDLQAVPRAIPSSQFRKAASGALIIDSRSPGSAKPWVEHVLGDANRSSETFRSWMESITDFDAGRELAPSLVAIFGEWHQPNWSANTILMRVLDAAEITAGVRSRLLGMVLNRAGSEKGARGRFELLLELCGRRETELSSVTSLLDEQTHLIFSESRHEGLSLLISLLGSELTEVGKYVLQKIILELNPIDLEAFPDSQAPLLLPYLGANPKLALAPSLWRGAGSRTSEMLSQLDMETFTENEKQSLVEAILASGRDASIDMLIKLTGSNAVFKILSALVAGELSFSPYWRSTISVYSDVVIEWLQQQPTISSSELYVASLFLRPSSNPQKLENVWHVGTSNSSEQLPPRVAAFGLALAFSRQAFSSLFETCFQSTFDALAGAQVDHEAWEWLDSLAPAVSWWRDWDRCERIATVLARRLETHKVPLAKVFSIVRTAPAIRKVVGALDADRQTRRYLKLLKMSSNADPNLGSRVQRDALTGTSR